MTEIFSLSNIITSEIISVADWINVPDNPRQRNTIQRAGLAKSDHLAKYSPSQVSVVMARMNGNILCKIDGHTRAHLWKTRNLELPPNGNVIATVYHVKSLEEAKALYDQHDSRSAVKKTNDVLYSTVQEYGFHLESPLLRPCTFSWQLEILERMSHSYLSFPMIVEKWKPYLIQLDNLWLSNRYKVLIGFMLVAIKYKGIEIAGEFLAKLDKGQGSHNSEGMDGIDALVHTINYRRSKNMMNKEIHRKETWEVAWSGFMKWIDNVRVKGNRRLTPNHGMWEVIRPVLQNNNVSKTTVTVTTSTLNTEDSFTEADTIIEEED
jgi:hypothetical protein